MTKFAPWATDEWLGDEFSLLLDLEIPSTNPIGVAETTRRALETEGFGLQAVVHSPPAGVPGILPGTSQSMLFERRAFVDARTAIRDLLMPDGGWEVISFALMSLLFTAFWVGAGAPLVGDPWALTWEIGLPIGIIGFWIAARTRRFVRTVGVRADLIPVNNNPVGGSRLGTRLVLSASRIDSQIDYPKPTYEARRRTVDANGTTDVGPILPQLRASLQSLA